MLGKLVNGYKDVQTERAVPMGKLRKIETELPAVRKRKRVAVYARVSKDTNRLSHSLLAQVHHYRTMIEDNTEWESAGIYADWGISGTGTEKRDEFQRLLRDCGEGKIDMVLTKSISRLARNTIDLLETVRYLKELGVDVYFEKEQIHSMSGDGELMLSIFASFAQEESQSISENIKWGIQKRFKTGEMGAANKHILGYRYDEEQKKYVIVPEEAEIVRWMFCMYVQKLPLKKIADALNQAGYKSVRGYAFTGSSVNAMLHNEIYAGDIRRQKYFVKDPIGKNKVSNRGQLPQYYIKDCHEAILTGEFYTKVQAERKRRAAMQNHAYCFTGKIKCDICKMPYTRRKSESGGRTYVYWVCRTKKRAGQVCKSVTYSEKKLQEICCWLMGTKDFDEAVFAESVTMLTALPDGTIICHFKKGGSRRWQKV